MKGIKNVWWKGTKILVQIHVTLTYKPPRYECRMPQVYGKWRHMCRTQKGGWTSTVAVQIHVAGTTTRRRAWDGTWPRSSAAPAAPNPKRPAWSPRTQILAPRAEQPPRINPHKQNKPKEANKKTNPETE